ncbi:MAG: hypothetical protein WBZ20_02485, partial [Nitrososphaeraceae archaeon]
SSLCDVFKMHSTLVVRLLEESFEIARKIICQHGGIVDNLFGDRIMALFESSKCQNVLEK